MSVRLEVAAALRTDLPDFLVIGYPRTPDAVTRPTVAVWQTVVRPVGDRWEVELDLWVLTGQEDPATADDVLDDALDAVIDALTKMPGLTWDQAERLVLDDKYQGYKITLRAAARNGA